MKSPHLLKKNLEVILRAAYAPTDLREFVQVCYDLALPLIRTKIHQGKINLDILGLKEADVVYDCIADLFERDSEGSFPQIKQFFADHIELIETSSEEKLIVTLRYLIFGKVNYNIVRLYNEADPALGKILRNLKLAVERTNLFEPVVRFGEIHLIPSESDSRLQLPPMPREWLKQEFTRVTLLHDNVPQMLAKLHRIMITQEVYQRAVPLVSTALLLKEIYLLSGNIEEATSEVVAQQGESEDIPILAEVICRKMKIEMHPTYVESGKRSKEVFQWYFSALKDILLAEFGHGQVRKSSYFDYLKLQMPDLTKEIYAKEHDTVLKYLAKLAKERMRQELRKS